MAEIYGYIVLVLLIGFGLVATLAPLFFDWE